jgi:hypothetical protein
MFLFQTTTTGDEFSTDGFKLYSEGIKSLWEAVKTAVIPENNVEILTSMETKAKAIQRSITGIALNPESAEKFRGKIEEIYFGAVGVNGGIVQIGGTVKDITDGMQGMSDTLGRSLVPSSEVLTNMVEMSKATGIGTLELGKMTAEFMKLTFSQEKSMSLINKISTDARRSGLSVKGVLAEVQANLSKVNAYNFKGGVEGLTKMVLEAKRLGGTIEEIGAASLGRSFAFDPEKAIEAAASMSMLGGSMSDLMNPFQLMNMGANNVGKLQSNLLEMSKSAFKVNEATGEIESNAIAQQRLYEQLKAFGKEGEYDKFINMGRESAKQAMIVKKVSDSGLGKLFGEGKMFDEKEQGLISQLAEVGKDGKISLELPGMTKIEDLTAELAKKGGPEAFEASIKEYQKQASMSDKDIATANMSIAEEQSKDVKIIKESILRQYTSAQRTDILKDVKTAIESTHTFALKNADKYAETTKTALADITTITEAANQLKKAEQGGNATTLAEMKKMIADANKVPKIDKTVPAHDGLFAGGSSDTPKLMSEGEVFDFIRKDQILAAPDIDVNLNILKESYLKMKELTSGINGMSPKDLPSTRMPKTESTQKTEVTETKVQKIEGSGTVNINVNITSSGNLADSLISDRRFKNHLEEQILDVIKDKDRLLVKKR